MNSKNWFKMFIAVILIIVIGIGGFNIITNPFGAFHQKAFAWDSYEFTMNPRVAKVNYLDEHHEEFDSYIIGSSAASSLPVDQLNQYLDANFYNAFMYGADMYDVKETANYFIDHYEMKNLLLCINVVNAVKYKEESNPLTTSLHYKTSEYNPVEFYSKYMFVNPRYGFNKIKTMKTDSYVQASHDVFQVKTGSYDKSKRDIERIQDMEDYLIDYPGFVNYPQDSRQLTYTQEFVKDTKEIVEKCQEKGIHLQIVFFPVYSEYAKYFQLDEVKNLYAQLAEVTDFWDFSISPLSKDPRFFYDESHFRNALGEMALGKMFNDESIYIPTDFGHYVTKDNAISVASRYESTGVLEDEAYTREVPILMYHHLDTNTEGTMSVTPTLFEEHIKALLEEGYTGVSLKELIAYTKNGQALPDKPIVITFDDGYLSNYTIAYPILEKYNMKASIFSIGVSFGKDLYKDTDYSMIPHFSYDQGKEMIESGLIEVQSHSYDMHQWGPYEEKSNGVRPSALRVEGEAEESYIETFRDDFNKMKQNMNKYMGVPVYGFAYPKGEYDDLTEILLAELGVEITLSSDEGMNTVIKGLPQSLRAMKRYAIGQDIPVDKLLGIIAE